MHSHLGHPHQRPELRKPLVALTIYHFYFKFIILVQNNNILRKWSCNKARLLRLLGWAGAQDRSLRKYADLVASYGLPSVRSVQPTGHIFSPVEWPRRRWAEALLRFITSKHMSPPR